MGANRGAIRRLAGAGAVLLAIGLTAVLLFSVSAGGAGAATSQYVAVTQHISSAAGGGDCGNIGSWDPATASCTLSVDLTFAPGAGIEIDSDSVTLNGNGHSMTGAGDGTADGVYLSGRSGVTVENLTVADFNNGVNLDTSSGNTVSMVSTSGNVATGLNLNAAGNNMLMSNNSSADAVGINLNNSNSNTLSMNMVMNSSMGDGISLQGSGNNIFTGNHSDMNAGNGFCIDPGNNNNSFRDNEASGNANNAFWLNLSDGNLITGNTTSNNNMAGMPSGMGGMAGVGEISLQDSSNNTIYHNSFTSMATPQASVAGGSGNVFNLSAPIGGNYWSSWTSPDADNDGFVDSPYVFMGGQDNLPLAAPVTSGMPYLLPAVQRVYWNSPGDYNAGLLSVEVLIKNEKAPGPQGRPPTPNDGADANNVEITGAGNTGGVTVASALPTAGGLDISAGGSAVITLTYNVPKSVSWFRTSLNASAQDDSGMTYNYPAPLM